MYFQTDWLQLRPAAKTTPFSKRGGRAMVIRNIPGKVICPECGSEYIETKLSLTTLVSRAGKLLGVPTIKIYEKRCVEFGHEFQIFRK